MEAQSDLLQATAQVSTGKASMVFTSEPFSRSQMRTCESMLLLARSNRSKTRARSAERERTLARRVNGHTNDTPSVPLKLMFLVLIISNPAREVSLRANPQSGSRTKSSPSHPESRSQLDPEEDSASG